MKPWQGKVLIDDIFSNPSERYIEQYKTKYKLLSEVIEKQFLYPNCRHTISTYFEEITTLPKVPDGKEAIKGYETEQKQRTLERQIRKWKRFEAGSMDTENVNNAVILFNPDKNIEYLKGQRNLF